MIGYLDLNYFDVFQDLRAEHQLETGEPVSLAAFYRTQSSPAAPMDNAGLLRLPASRQAPVAPSASDGEPSPEDGVTGAIGAAPLRPALNLVRTK